MRSRYVVFLILAVVALIGCQGEAVRRGGVRQSQTLTKVVSLSPSTTELLAAIAGTDLLKGRTSACNYPPTLMSQFPIVASVKPDYEAITKIKPDLLMYDTSLYNEQDIEKIKALGIPVFEAKANTIAAFRDELFVIGRDTHNEKSYSKYVDKIDNALDQGRAMIGTSKPKVAVIMPSDSGEHYISGKKSFLGDVMTQLGCEFVGSESDRFTPVNVEFLITSKPDIIVTAGSPDALLKDTRLASLKAIQQKRIIPLQADVALRKGARVDKLLEALASSITKFSLN